MLRICFSRINRCCPRQLLKLEKTSATFNAPTDSIIASLRNEGSKALGIELDREAIRLTHRCGSDEETDFLIRDAERRSEGNNSGAHEAIINL